MPSNGTNGQVKFCQLKLGDKFVTNAPGTEGKSFTVIRMFRSRQLAARDQDFALWGFSPEHPVTRINKEAYGPRGCKTARRK